MTAPPAPERPQRKATKTDLRHEIVRLRDIGGYMANLCFNLGRHYDPAKLYSKPYRITNWHLRTMADFAEAWDAIKRSEDAR